MFSIALRCFDAYADAAAAKQLFKVQTFLFRKKARELVHDQIQFMFNIV